MSSTALAVSAGLGFAAVSSASVVSPIADSSADFIAATQDGIGIVNVGGSPSDSAQQFHTDSTGSGGWSYGFGSSADGGAFSGGFPLLDDWNGNFWGDDGTPAIVSADGQAPYASSFSANNLTYRRWTSNGANEGDLLTARLSVTLTNAASDGVTVVFNVRDAGIIETVITPSMLDVEQVFELDLTDTSGNWVLAGINPVGINGPSGSDFFNDFVSIRLTIVPAPATAVLPATGLFFIARRRAR